MLDKINSYFEIAAGKIESIRCKNKFTAITYNSLT